MQANSLSSLIQTLVQSAERDAAAIGQRHALRQGLQAQAACSRRATLSLAGLDAGAGGDGKQGPQQACREHG